MSSIQNHVWRGVTILCFALLLGKVVRAQNTADLVGTVTDNSGAAIPGATVTLTNTGTNISQTALANDAGDYLFTLLVVGNYSVKVEAKGFKTFEAPSIALSAGDRARVDAKMEVGEQSTTVEVHGTVVPALQTDTSTLNTLVTSQNVEDLPLNGRNIIKLVQLSVGTLESPAYATGADDQRQGSQYSVNGQVAQTNNNMLDGLDDNERDTGTIGVRPSIDAIQEVTISANKYDASVGRTGGGVTDMISKSGTNSFHGSAYEFFRNKVLNSNPNWNFSQALNPNTVSPAVPNLAFRQNQWGGSVGGPIKKNKTFFFADYEGFSSATGSAAALYTVPTYCERGMGNSTNSFAKACPDGKVQVGDFSDTSLVSPLGGGNTLGGPGPDIPLASQTLLGLSLFNMYPLPNTGAPGATVNNFSSAPVQPRTNLIDDGRVDQHFSDKNSLFGRYTYNLFTTTDPTGFPSLYILPSTGAVVPASTPGALFIYPETAGNAGNYTNVDYALALSYVHVFNANLLLNLKASVLRYASTLLPVDEGEYTTNKLGFPCTATSCINTQIYTSGLVKTTVTSLNGGPAYTSIGDPGFVPTRDFDTAFQYLASLTWNKGAHSVRYGIGFTRRREISAQDQSPQGGFTFNGSYTGVAMGDLLEGLPITMSRVNALVGQNFRSWEPGVYVQDDWRARPWLTLNIGGRYDIFTPFTEIHGRFSNYDPYLGLLVGPSIPGIQQSNSTGGVPTPYGDLAPRFGFAATLKHNMVVRGGFGLTFWPNNYETPSYMKNAPFNYIASCTVQTEIGSANSCAAAQYDGPVGQFANSAVASYGLAPCLPKAGATASGPCPANTTPNSSSTVAATGGPAGVGGALMAAGEPVPVLNIATATSTALYTGTTITSMPTNYANPYLEQMNLNVQKQIGANVISVGYVGELGRRVVTFNSDMSQNIAANPTENSALPLTVGGKTQIFGVLQGYPYLAKTTVNETLSNATSSYQSLQAVLTRRFSNGLTVNVNYTWAHNMTNEANNGCVESEFTVPTPCFVDNSNGVSSANPRLVYGYQQYSVGNTTFDVADRVAWAINYQIPFGKSMTGIKGAIVKGWGVNTDGSWQTGTPFQASASTSNSNISGTQLLDQTGAGRLSHPTILDWFNLNDFVQPAAGTLGNQGAEQFFGPSQKRLDGSLFKDFPVKEQIKLQFRAEVFNLFNSSDFGTPTSTIAFNSDGTVNLTGSHVTTGQITAMNTNWSQREFQFALKLLF